MPDNRYRDAMDKVRASEGFEARTAARLEKELYNMEGSKKPARRRPLRFAGYAAAALAAALAVVLIVPGVLPDRWTAMRGPDAVQNISVPVELMDRSPVTSTVAVAAGAGDGAVTLPQLPGKDGVATLPNPSGNEAVTTLPYPPAEDAMLAPPPGMAAPAQGLQPNTDEYAYIRENGFQSTLTSPLSTFAADVDTASYANIRRMLLEGALPPADAVRIEEMINYFRYDYPAPKDGEPFSVTTEIAPCPWNPDAKLLLVGLQAREIDASERPACNLVFLLDVSGSMDGPDRLGLAQKAFLLLTEQLKPGDKVSIVTYAGSDSVVLTGATVEDRAKITEAIENLFAGGSTAGSEGIKTAYRIAREQFIDGGLNRVILATDGDLNVGVTSEGELTRLIEEEKKSGVFLSVMGFGSGNYKDNKLEALADHGDGNYAFIDSELEARKVLVEEMGASFFTVCKDAKFQIEFNPARVKQYRQIGYENRALNDQDFANDAKDGGEIGAGHRVTALYEIIEADGSEQGGELKYQTNETTGSSEYLTVSVRAKEPDGDVSKLYQYPVGQESVRETPSDDMAFAAAVAEVGMLLRGSEHSGAASYHSAAALLEKIPGLSADPYKDEFAYLVRQLARGRIG
jgi:Ca-activated chloride channel family protein